MRIKSYRFAALVILCAAVPAYFLLNTDAPQASIQPGQIYLELVGGGSVPFKPGIGATGPAITPDCTSWHELYPTYCSMHHQDAYTDNGDGALSPCDNIVLGGIVYHVDWVGPTYVLTDPSDHDHWMEPTDLNHNPNSPICEVWEEVHPGTGLTHHVDNWIDNGDGVLSVCDEISSAGILYHVAEVNLNIRVSPGGVPTRPSTWGKIKSAIWPF